MTEIFVSTDIEADGPIPGPHSMLSLGSAAFTADGKLVSTFYATLVPLKGASGHPTTMAWWGTQPKAYAQATKDSQPPESVMKLYLSWLKQLPSAPIFVGYPAGFDFLFVYWYLMKFVGESPFSFSALDIKTFAMAILKTNWKQTTKRNMPQRWFGAFKHTHHALDDAIEQGHLFINMLKENRK